MTQEERLDILIGILKNENSQYANLAIPNNQHEKRDLFRSLLNVRPATSISKEFLELQDEYLQCELLSKGVISLDEAEPTDHPHLFIWQGDITRLQVDAIVNAANNALLGCFVPCHGCIDNAIHSAAGVQLRLDCAELMKQQHTPEPTGKAKITKGYNLPTNFVLHTVGPIIHGNLTEQDCKQLADCYRSCLALASENKLSCIAFCCISTGEFHFPQEKAAEIAIQTVKEYIRANEAPEKVIFNVFKERDYAIYKRILG